MHKLSRHHNLISRPRRKNAQPRRRLTPSQSDRAKNQGSDPARPQNLNRNLNRNLNPFPFSNRLLQQRHKLFNRRRQHSALLVNHRQRPEILAILDLHRRQALVGHFLPDRFLRHNRNA